MRPSRLASANALASIVMGLPVVGFMAYNIINAQAQPGVLANYGGTFRHRPTVSRVGASANCLH